MITYLDVPGLKEPIVIRKSDVFGAVAISALVFLNSILINFHDFTHCKDSGGGDVAIMLAPATATGTIAMCGPIPDTIMEQEYSAEPVGKHSDVEIPDRPPGDGHMTFVKTRP